MIYLLLPAYNEALSLPNLLPKVEALYQHYQGEVKVTICDDGSTDETAHYLKEFEDSHEYVTVITHKLNRGLGETIRDLMEFIVDELKDDDIVVRVECDNSHEPKFIPSMIDKLNEGYDVVTASRFQKGGSQKGVSRYKAFISYCANLFMKFFFNIKGIHEYSCGFRAYRGAIIKRAIHVYGNNFIQLKGMGFTCTLEKLVKLRLLGAKFAEVPFELRYDKKLSSSKMIGSITTLGYITMTCLYFWPWGGWRIAYKHHQVKDNKE